MKPNDPNNPTKKRRRIPQIFRGQAKVILVFVFQKIKQETEKVHDKHRFGYHGPTTESV
jgi:hypothetical protein